MAGSPLGTRTVAKEKRNKKQIDPGKVYSFGPFELYPAGRQLTRNGKVVSLTPKTYDLLLLLIENAGELVPKSMIWKSIWPDTQVEDANLTNAIASIRRVLGRKTVQTKPKHGYQFSARLVRRPGTPPETLARFEEANSLLPARSPEALFKARMLYWICLADVPDFAPAWAGLGRCCRFLAKYQVEKVESTRLAEAAFERALAIDPDLVSAHQFYTLLQADRGQSNLAVARLVRLARHHPDDARIYGSLIHVLRFCGLLAESLLAQRRAGVATRSSNQPSPHDVQSL